MDKFTLQEEAHKRGYEKGFAEGKKAAFWHYAEDDPFKPEQGKHYLIHSIVGRDTEGGPVLSGPKVTNDKTTSTIAVFCWAEIPEA
jgi:hypothetical protein